jgi:ubiquinone/menaquinone biosynthesis C-methylase UbiE
MSVTTREYLDRQYGSASNLNARVLLHARFSRNTYGWYRWVMDQFDLPPEARILELGGGTGALWSAVRSRVPAGWRVLLSDRSPGMVASASEALAGDDRFTFRVIDAQEIPLDDASCDAVVANHMLYHVADLPRTLSEIRRVLRRAGGSTPPPSARGTWPRWKSWWPP